MVWESAVDKQHCVWSRFAPGRHASCHVCTHVGMFGGSNICVSVPFLTLCCVGAHHSLGRCLCGGVLLHSVVRGLMCACTWIHTQDVHCALRCMWLGMLLAVSALCVIAVQAVGGRQTAHCCRLLPQLVFLCSCMLSPPCMCGGDMLLLCCFVGRAVAAGGCRWSWGARA